MEVMRAGCPNTSRQFEVVGNEMLETQETKKGGNPPQDCPNTSNQRFTLHKQYRLSPAALPARLNSVQVNFCSEGVKLGTSAANQRICCWKPEYRICRYGCNSM